MSEEFQNEQPEADLSRTEPESYATTSHKVLNPWLSIWLRPRATIQQITCTNPHYGLFILPIVYGALAYSSLIFVLLPDDLSIWIEATISIVGGGVYGLISFHLLSYFTFWFGEAIGGKGSLIQVRSALVWSIPPAIIMVLLIYLREFHNVIWDGGMFPGNEQTVRMGLNGLAILFRLYSLLILLECLGLVHDFTIGRAFKNILISRVAYILAIYVAFGVYHVITDTWPFSFSVAMALLP